MFAPVSWPTALYLVQNPSAGRELRCPAMGPKPPDQLQVHLLASQIVTYKYPQLLKLGIYGIAWLLFSLSR